MSDKQKREQGWVRVQIQLFTLWMDEVLQQRQMNVEDLSSDLKDGIRLINFFELLSGQSVKTKYDLRPKNRIHMINNLNIGLKFLDKEMMVKNPGCFAEDIVDADIHGVKLILGLMYVLYRKYRMGELLKGKKGKVKKGQKEEDALLDWVREVTDDYGIKVENFRTSFNDGKAYLALAHIISGGSFDFNEFKDLPREQVLEKAFSVAEDNNIHRLLMVDEVANGDIDERALVLYTSLYHHEYLKKKELEALQGDVEKNQAQLELEAKSKDDLIKLNVDLSAEHESLTNELKQKEEEVVEKRQLLSDYLAKGNELDAKIQAKKEEFGKVDLEKNDKEVAVKGEELRNERLKEKYETFVSMKEDDNEEIESLKKQIEETKKLIEERKKQLEEAKVADSIASQYVEQEKKGNQMKERKEELEEDIEELEEEVGVLKKTVKTAEDDLEEDKKELDRATGLQKMYLDIKPLDKHLRGHVSDLMRFKPYLNEKGGEVKVDEAKLRLLKEESQGDYKEIFKDLAEQMQVESDEVGKIVTDMKKEEIKKQDEKKNKLKASMKASTTVKKPVKKSKK